MSQNWSVIFFYPIKSALHLDAEVMLGSTLRASTSMQSPPSLISASASLVL